jgi:hypothetical protein
MPVQIPMLGTLPNTIVRRYTSLGLLGIAA